MIYHYRILGTAQARRPDGTEVPLKGARLRALLVALAAGGGRPVAVARLIAQVWGEEAEPPADAPAALQALVGRLRRALGGAAVTSSPGGYALAAEADAVDLFRFERLTAEGIAALRAGDPAGAAGLLDEALALWHGPALADLPDRDGDPLAVRAERRHGEARRARLAAEVACGRAADTLAELAALAAAEPLDEPLQALYIRALSAAGRQAEALQAYEEVRAGLAERLGTDPGTELRSLYAELLARAPGPAPEPRTPAPPVRLRSRLSSFVGRDTEIAWLREGLGSSRLVTLLGAGGVGKTRLALEAADAAVVDGARWPDGVRVAELASVRDAENVPEAVLTALGGHPTQVRAPGADDLRAPGGPTTPLAQVVEHCGQRRLLLVLDNCEHVIGAAAGLAHAVLAGCPGVTVLATSREPLGVPGESVRPVEPLPPSAALRLLAERGAAARTGFRTEDDPAACAEICRRLDGLPLAIELAAARLRALTPRQIADRLDDRFRLLSGGSRTALPRQQTLRAVVDWSWDLLTSDERAVLRRLAVFAGGCEVAEAEQVCAAPGLADGPRSPADVLDALTSLVDKSLVIAAPESPRGMRYRLLETVAEYAGERLTESGERAAVELRHLTAYRELARTGEPGLRGPRQAEWLARLETEHDNVRAALRTAVGRGEEQEGLCLALSMSWFWQLRNHQADARHWAAAVADLGPDPFADPVRPAEPLADRCTAVAPPWSGERLWEARRGVRLLVLAGSGEGAGPSGPVRAESVVAAYRPGLPQTGRQPGVMWFFARLMTGGFAGLDETVDAVVRHCRELGDGWELGLALLLRTKLLDNRPAELDRSARDAEEALALFEEAGDLWGIAESLSARGDTYERRGQYALADADFSRAMEASERIGAHAQVPEFKARLASVRLEGTYGTEEGAAVRSPRVQQAERLLLEAVAESRPAAGETLSTARLLLARHYGRTGRTGLAREQLNEAEQAFTSGTPPIFTGMVSGLHGWLDCLDGDFVRAREHVRRAVRQLAALAHLVAPYLVTHQFLCAAWAMAELDAAGAGAAEEGARLLGAYDRHASEAEGFGFQPLPPAVEARVRERAGAAVRAALSVDAYESAYREGGGLSVKEAAALI
ncbi:AfsR family transcriptional regulator [Streptomyces sp. WAC 06783]|uniref:ATP-binding protein n=1 Tax=Streptomyces sp. WAC 06783 TaxID=2203211 RepID=UPI000F74898A|nr:BTAD domain-containing putative transcriptional regulator [Streptomyces sp. WAC 06783]RSO11570.1 AfsR family transcriptional regulator [Streptomyces sp. WAC 06783]